MADQKRVRWGRAHPRQELTVTEVVGQIVGTCKPPLGQPSPFFSAWPSRLCAFRRRDCTATSSRCVETEWPWPGEPSLRVSQRRASAICPNPRNHARMAAGSLIVLFCPAQDPRRTTAVSFRPRISDPAHHPLAPASSTRLPADEPKSGHRNALISSPSSQPRPAW